LRQAVAWYFFQNISGAMYNNFWRDVEPFIDIFYNNQISGRGHFGADEY